jgi:hypothetical protein
MKNHINTIKRNLQVKQGAFDGRYREKVVADGKKKASKESCRNFLRGKCEISW